MGVCRHLTLSLHVAEIIMVNSHEIDTGNILHLKEDKICYHISTAVSNWWNIFKVAGNYKESKYNNANFGRHLGFVSAGDIWQQNKHHHRIQHA